jgi:hypothetical protein
MQDPFGDSGASSVQLHIKKNSRIFTVAIFASKTTNAEFLRFHMAPEEVSVCPGFGLPRVWAAPWAVSCIKKSAGREKISGSMVGDQWSQAATTGRRHVRAL